MNIKSLLLAVALLSGCSHHTAPAPDTSTVTTPSSTAPVTTALPSTAPASPTWINPPTSSGIGKG